MEGSSFAPLLDSAEFIWKRAAFSQVKRTNGVMGRSVRTAQYRYTSWDTAGEELYDHYADPHEYTNLAHNTRYATVLNQMRTILADGWKKSLPPVYKLKRFYKDYDKDGYGNLSDSVLAYAKPKGYVTKNTDCNDGNANVHPGATEICDGVDNNCDGRIDENKACNSIIASAQLDVNSSKRLSVYPNPSKGNITVTFMNNTVGRISLHIYNVNGKTVFTSDDMLAAKGINIKRINLYKLEPGVYFLSLHNNEIEDHTSLIIAR